MENFVCDILHPSVVDFTVMSLHAGVLQWSGSADELGFSEQILEDCRSIYNRLCEEKIPALTLNVEPYPMVEVGLGIPRTFRYGKLPYSDMPDILKDLFWIGIPGQGVLSLHLVIDENDTKEILEERQVAILVACSEGRKRTVEELGGLAGEILDRRPALISTLFWPLADDINRRSLGSVREVSRHLAKIMLEG